MTYHHQLILQLLPRYFKDISSQALLSINIDTHFFLKSVAQQSGPIIEEYF